MSTPAPFTAKRPAARNAWTALGVLLVVYLVNFMDRQVFAVLQEEFRVDLNLSDSQLALLGGTALRCFTPRWASPSPSWPTAQTASV